MKTSAPSDVVSKGLETLCGRYGLPARAQDQMLAVLGCLSSGEGAPTTVREPGQALHAHLADSLAALDLEAVRSAVRIADLGAGAGFPGLPLAIALPASQVRLVESHRRKCAFIERVCQTAAIDDARVVWTRAEEWAEGMEANDIVLARAVAPPPVVLEYSAPLLRVGGMLVDWRGRRNAEEEAAATAAAAELGLQLDSICSKQPYPGVRAHHLHTYLKVAPTPARFPRRAGVARKRPLGC